MQHQHRVQHKEHYTSLKKVSKKSFQTNSNYKQYVQNQYNEKFTDNVYTSRNFLYALKV